MKSDVSKSLNKFFEERFKTGFSNGLISTETNLIFDLYDRVEEYPKAVIRVKDVDTLDHAWRTTSTVSFKIFVDKNDVELLNELANYAIGVIKDSYMAIPIYNYIKVISEKSNPRLQAGERVLPDGSGKFFLRTKPKNTYKNNPSYLEESLVIYIYDFERDVELNELVKDVDFKFNSLTGEVIFINQIDLPENTEIRAFYIVREFVKIGKIIPDTLLEIPMYVGDNSSHGGLTSEILFHFIS